MNFQPTDAQQLDLGLCDPGNRDSELEVVCHQCGDVFQLPGWFSAAGLEFQFCTSECRKAWTKGTEAATVELKARRDVRGANWKIQSRLARERDGFRCFECGVGEQELGRQLDVHHRIPFRRFKSNVEANKLEHLISLCASCHKRSEAQMQRDLPLFTGK